MADGYTLGPDGRIGERFAPGNGFRYAQLLGRQNYNNGTHGGGLANVAQQIFQAMLLKDDMNAQAKDVADTNMANTEMVRGLMPWKNPDTGQYEGPAGGIEGGLAALEKLGPGNAAAGKLSQALLMHKVGRDQQLADKADDRGFQREMFGAQDAAAARRQQEGFSHAERLQQANFGQQQSMFGAQTQAQQDLARLAAQLREFDKNNLVPVADDGSPTGFRYVSAQNAVNQPAPNPNAKKTGNGTMPAAALKMQAEDLDAIGAASSIGADLGAIGQQISGGRLNLGPIDNTVAGIRNWAGFSDENSRNLATFKSTLERLRNESLRLNKGVQTEGDAVRAWNELLANINDPALVQKRIGEIQSINNRAADLRKMNMDVLRGNYGLDPMDVTQFRNVPPAVSGGPNPSDPNSELPRGPAPLNDQDREALAWAQANQNDPRATKIMQRLAGAR